MEYNDESITTFIFPSLAYEYPGSIGKDNCGILNLGYLRYRYLSGVSLNK